MIKYPAALRTAPLSWMHGEHTPARFRRSLAKNANGIRGIWISHDVLPVVNNVLLNRDAAITANDSFVAVTDKLASNIERLFENGVETDIILYLGLCNGAGWATSLDGRDAVLLGIEKIIELNWQMNPPCRL